ncbi:ketopantoate reductase family protein [Nioella sp.]|uniref:ketopantoate reductase family protein n=1 Tax=Nioella sp. TaxID=1912091 RepID=UPI003B523CDA
MRIAVLGAGAMGSVYGARLARAGAEVTLLDVNDAHVAAINEGGLHVALDEGDSIHHLPAMRPEAFRGPADLVLLFTKVFHTDEALTSVKPLLADAHVLSLQNGVGNVDRIAAHMTRDRILIGMTMTPAEYLGPGRVASHGAATTDLFSASGQDLQFLHKIAALMDKGGITARLEPDIDVAIWEKATFNCALNPICALSGGTPGSVGASEAGRGLAASVVAEAIAVAKASGVNASLDKVTAMMEHAFAHHLHHEPSMLQDRMAGRRTEIDALNGAVVRIGDRLGVPTPANRIVTDLIRLTEDSTRYRA